jgi:predicted transcriptional regulator
MAAKPLNQYRETLYLNVDEFAKHVGISLQTYYRILAGERPRYTTMRRIAEALGVHPSEIREFLPRERPDE